MLDKIGFGEGDSGKGERQPHHTRHGTRMDEQPTILAVHSPSRIRNAIARVLPLATPLWVEGPCVAGGRGPARSFPRVPFLSLLCPHSCAPPHRQIYMADTSNIKYHVSRIQCNPDPASAVRPRRSGVDRRGARRRTHRHTRRSAFALTFTLASIRQKAGRKVPHAPDLWRALVSTHR